MWGRKEPGCRFAHPRDKRSRLPGGQITQTIGQQRSHNEDAASVFALPDYDAAFVVCDGAEEAELIELVAGELSHHKRPREIRFVDALPRNAMGKVQKKLLG